MFLDAVILVLQEILEAALLISVLLALTHLLRKTCSKDFAPGYQWLIIGILTGLAGAWIFAKLTPQISPWFDYAGLEIVNAFMQLMIISFLLFLAYTITFEKLQNHRSKTNKVTIICLTSVIALGIIREVSEIILYLGGIMAQPENVTPVTLGSFVALGIGVSSGIFLFYLLINLSTKWTLRASMLLLALFTGNMASQVSLLLTQADWAPYTSELWDSSNLIPEYSIIGQILYALIGYESTPSWLQAVCYLGAVLLLCISPMFRQIWQFKHAPVGNK